MPEAEPRPCLFPSCRGQCGRDTPCVKGDPDDPCTDLDCKPQPVYDCPLAHAKGGTKLCTCCEECEGACNWDV